MYKQRNPTFLLLVRREGTLQLVQAVKMPAVDTIFKPGT